MARTSPNQRLSRPVEVPANQIPRKVGFGRRQFAGLLEAKWSLKERVAGYLGEWGYLGRGAASVWGKGRKVCWGENRRYWASNQIMRVCAKQKKWADRRIQRNGAGKKGGADTCWLLQEGPWCISLAQRTAPSHIPCPGGARPWRGRRGLLDNILKLALALLSFLLPCWGCPGLLASKPQVSQQRNSKQPLVLALRVLGEYMSLPEQPSVA